ncbi:hypothetical protein Misp04_04660 [Micromonospora sp. NBRC 101691]|nr:hypothetical protein Misp04_04660 [Micromonospora sp. NBRC 101691]
MIARPFGSRQSPLVTQTARASATSTITRSARRLRVGAGDGAGGPVSRDGEVGTERTLPTV